MGCGGEQAAAAGEGGPAFGPHTSQVPPRHPYLRSRGRRARGTAAGSLCIDDVARDTKVSAILAEVLGWARGADVVCRARATVPQYSYGVGIGTGLDLLGLGA